MINTLFQSLDSDALRDAAMSTAAGQELVSRYVVGKSASAVPPAITDLVSKGMYGCVEYLSQEAKTHDQARAHAQEYLKVINELRDAGFSSEAEISLQLSWLGISLPNGREIALEHAREIARHALNCGINVTVAMGRVLDTQSTRWVGDHLQQDLPDVAVTLRASLLDVEDHAKKIAREGQRIKIIKGHHDLMSGITQKRRHDTDLSYVRVIAQLIEARAVPLIATHDERIVRIAESLLRKADRKFGEYEFQMVLGVRPWEQRRLADVGHVSRVFLPYGDAWFDYYLEQMTSSPAMACTFLRSLTRKR